MPPSPWIRLFTGPEEHLLRRAADRAIAELRASGDVELVDVRAAELRDGGLPDLRTGSLFGGRRAVLLRDAQDLPPPAVDALSALLDGEPPDADVLLLATSTARWQKLAKRIADLGGKTDIPVPREWDARGWSALVTAELAVHGRSAKPTAVTALLDHAGFDVTEIAQKVAQVAASAPPGTITAEHVEAAVVGRGSRGSFAIADAMTDREPARALQLLRGALEAGDDPILILGALVHRLRSIVAVAGSLDPKVVGLATSPAQARRLQAVRKSFGPGELTAAYRALADADDAIKGREGGPGDLPAALVLERAVVTIATRSPA